MPCRRSDEETPTVLEVGEGFALDRHGREVVLDGGTPVDSTNTFLIDRQASGCSAASAIDTLAPGLYVLSVHYAERQTGEARIPEGCGCPKPEKNFVCETAAFSLRLTDGECPCAEQHCHRHCHCGQCGDCPPGGRGPHSCLCRWVEHVPPPGCAPLCEWQGLWIDPADGVPLACVRIGEQPDSCKKGIAGLVMDNCGPRRLVKNNDLLYDLVRGCDLTHIAHVSWHAWHRSPVEVPWHEFAERFHTDGRTDFVVRFSRPVLAETIHPDVVVMRAITVEQATGWRVVHRVPIRAIDTTPSETLPAGTTDQMRVLIHRRWYEDEIRKREESWLSGRSFHMEIEIRGDYILDCHRQSVDAEAVGLAATPTGNGSPGGTYLSNFHVAAKPVQDTGTTDDIA
jgi:hypothetical protein